MSGSLSVRWLSELPRIRRHEAHRRTVWNNCAGAYNPGQSSDDALILTQYTHRMIPADRPASGLRDRPTVVSSCHCVDCLEESAR